MIDAEHARLHRCVHIPSQSRRSQVHDCAGWDYAGLRRSGARSQKPNRKLADQQFISKAAPERVKTRSCCIKLPAPLGVLRATSGPKLSSWLV